MTQGGDWIPGSQLLQRRVQHRIGTFIDEAGLSDLDNYRIPLLTNQLRIFVMWANNGMPFGRAFCAASAQ